MCWLQTLELANSSLVTGTVADPTLHYALYCLQMSPMYCVVHHTAALGLRPISPISCDHQVFARVAS